ncbi:MAG: hypothetical protein ACRDZO_19210 [Egibacteraceae bacterium]
MIVMVALTEPADSDDATAVIRAAAAALVAKALALCEQAHLELPAMLLRDALDCLTGD